MNNRRRRRHVALGAAAISACLVIAACGNGDAPSDSNGGSGEGDESVSLTWSMWSDTTEQTAELQELADLVTETHPHIELDLQTATFNDYWTRLVAQSSGGTSACILGVQAPRLAGIQNLVAPLGEEDIAEARVDLEDFDTAAIEASQLDGVQVALPYDTGPRFIFFNADRFEEAGVPEPELDWSVEDFEEAVAALSEESGQYGFAVEPNLDAVVAWAVALQDTQPVTEDGELALTDPGVVATIEWLRGLVEDGYAPELVSTSDSYNALNVFISGSAAMSIAGPWNLQNVYSNATFSVGAVPLPAGVTGSSATVLSGSGYGVSTGCEHPEEALQAIAVLTGAEAQELSAESGRTFPSRTAQQELYFQGDIAEAEEAVLVANAEARPLLTTENWSAVSQLFQQHVVTTLNGQMEPEDMLQTVQDQQESL